MLNIEAQIVWELSIAPTTYEARELGIKVFFIFVHIQGIGHWSIVWIDTTDDPTSVNKSKYHIIGSHCTYFNLEINKWINEAVSHVES